MSKSKRIDKKRPILVNKQTKIFDLFPSGAYASGLKMKDFKGIIKSGKKGNKLGGVIKASEGASVSPKLTDYTKSLIGKADQGIGSGITKTKSLLARVKEKIAKAGEIMKKGPSAASASKPGEVFTQLKKPSFTLPKGSTSKAGEVFKKLGKSKALRLARLATPIGAATVVATSIKKRDPKAVKRERDFYKGKKYKDVGFESMMDYAKPKMKGGAVSYNKGGFNYAINKKR